MVARIQKRGLRDFDWLLALLAIVFALLARRGIWSPPLVGRLKPIKSRSRNSAFGVFAAFVIEIPSEFRSSLFECDPPIKHPIMATGQQKIAKCTGKAIV